VYALFPKGLNWIKGKVGISSDKIKILDPTKNSGGYKVKKKLN
jgi:hypothetical protein